MRRVLLTLIAIGFGSVVAYAQHHRLGSSINGGSTPTAPGGVSTDLQFNTNSSFGGISGVTSDSANVGFATSSQLILYGFAVGDCVKIGASNQLADSGGACGGSGAPGGLNTQIQFNTNGTFGGVTGAVSTNASVIAFSTNSLVINGQAISGVSGTTGTLATVTGSLSTNCVKADGSGNLIDAGSPCGGTSATNIAAGTNITTSGTTSNVTVNVVATPSFTTVIASGNVTAGAAQFTGAASGTTAQFQTYTGNNIVLSGNGTVTASTIQLSGLLTATTGNFSGLVVQGLSGCIQSSGGTFTGTGVNCATQTSTPSIAAGTNITTSGTAANTTVNVVATPSFTTVIASGNLTAGSAQFAGFLTAGGASISGLNLATGTISGNLTGATANFSGNLTGTTAQFTGFLTASGANLQTATIVSLGATTQCLQSVAGVITGFSAPCATQTSTPSIAAGTNITTSGTAANTTVNVVATPSFTSVIATGDLTAARAQFTGFLTASGTNLQTATIASLGATTQCVSSVAGVITGFGSPCATQVSTPSIAAGTNITTSGTAANTTINLVATPSVTTLIASGNLTAATAQFSGFLTAGGASLSGLTIATETLSGNLTGTTANFSGNLTGTTAQFTGAVTGTSAQFQTHTGSTANLTGNLTGSTAQFSGQVTGTTAVFQTVTAQNFTTLAQGFVGTPAAGSGTAFLRGDNTFSTPTTLGLAASTTTTPLGWINVNGNGRLTADSVGFITTGFVNLITLTGLVAGRTYYFNAELPLKSATASTGGIALRVGGGATATSIVYDGWIVDSGFNGIKGNTQATALSTSVANSSITGTTSHARLVGTITVNAAGSIVLQASAFSTVTAASAVTVGRGATFTAQDIP